MESIKTIALWVVFIGGVIFGVHSCANSEWWQEDQRRTEAEHAAAAKPHVIREADGCKVYAWVDNGGTGTTHHFTRCPNAMTTDERNYTVNCGKGCTKHLSEITVTESK